MECKVATVLAAFPFYGGGACVLARCHGNRIGAKAST